MKNFKYFPCVILLFLFVIGCQKLETNDAEIEPVFAEMSSQDIIAHKFGKQLAARLGEKPIRDFIKSEAELQYDGDYDILFVHAKNKEIESVNGRGVKLTFGEALFHSNDPTRSDMSDYNELLVALDEEYPTMQIAIPQLEETSVEDWNTELHEPIVVILPTDFDESTHDYVLGYDNLGNTVQLSTTVEPEELVVVVSQSERVLAFEKEEDIVRSEVAIECFLDAPIASNTRYDIYMMDDISTVCGGDGIPSGGGSNPAPPSCDNVNLYQLYLNDIGLKDIESWVSGAPELKVWRYTLTGNTYTSVKKFGTMEPSKRKYIKNKWWEVKGGIGKDMFNWNEGDGYALWFWEYDPIRSLGEVFASYGCPMQCFDSGCGKDQNGNHYPLNEIGKNCIEQKHDEIGESPKFINNLGCNNLSTYSIEFGNKDVINKDGLFKYKIRTQ